MLSFVKNGFCESMPMSEREYKTTTRKWHPNHESAPDPVPPNEPGKWKLLNLEATKPQPAKETIKRRERNRDAERQIGAWFEIWEDKWVTVPHWDNSVTFIWTWEKES